MKQKHSLQNSHKFKQQNQFTLKTHHQQLLPSCSIFTMLKLYAQNPTVHTSRQEKQQQNKQKYYPSPNYELNRKYPNKLVFHHYQKFNTFQFQFNRIFNHIHTNTQFSTEIDLFQTIVQQNKDACMIVMGKSDSGIQSICEGSNAAQNQGIIFGMISKLWSKVNNQKNKQTTYGINSIKIVLKCLIVSDQKMYDLLCPKNEVILKDINNKIIISGCQTYQIKNAYDLYAKLLQVYNQKRLIYSQCIMVVQADIIISKESHFITDQELTHRSFTFVQWQKNSISHCNNNRQNNNQSLLVFNMCIYQLYKISCHNVSNLGDTQIKKLWSNFRNSYITMIIKYYFMGNNQIFFVSCASLKESQQQENYQVLMVAKNLAKITFNYNNRLTQVRFTNKFKPQKSQLFKNKMQTQSTQAQKFPNSTHLQKLKQNLKKILKEKQQIQGIKQKKQQIISLFKQQKQKKIQLQNIRYKQQQIKVIQDFNKIKSNSRINYTKSSNKPISLPTLQMKKRSNQLEQEQMHFLQKQRESTLKQIDQIHEKIINNVRSQSNQQLAKKTLQMQIKLHEKQMIQYINNKNKIVNLLKRQINSIKTQPNQQLKTKNYKTKRRTQSRVQSPYQTLEIQQHQININPEKNQEQEQVQEKDQEIFKMQNFKKINKKNYLFEKRRLILKNKLAKGREQVNNFYEEAAKKFQEYRSK